LPPVEEDSEAVLERAEGIAFLGEPEIQEEIDSAENEYENSKILVEAQNEVYLTA